ncbi:MAG: pyrroline-5-carboxylate reductase [Candidatus Omnitrophica bacterium]|nr:pyrroline-5-carboxylate reductase [Candidatus Omnitrophota bacterium]
MLGIIGFGNMGSAIAEYAKKQFRIIAFDKIKAINDKYIEVANDLSELMAKSEAIILAVKPQDMDNLIEDIKGNLKDQLIISIAAGITTSYFENRLGKVRVVRVMPNLPAQIGEGVAGLCKGKFADEKDFDFAWQLFSHIGLAVTFDDESMLDMITAISGSGPAYFCYYIKDRANVNSKKDEFIQELTRAAINLGFDRTLAACLSERTVNGTISLLIEKNWSCEELINRVASKGGTTEAALEVLRHNGTLTDAVNAAFKRAKELARR